jgi:hypothetical protein
VPVVGPRFLIEAGFIITVAVVAGVERLDTLWIIAVVGAAWLVVAAVEIGIWVAARRPARTPVPEKPEPLVTPAPAPRAPAPEPERPRVVPQPAPPPKPAPVLVPVPPPEPKPSPQPEPTPAAEPEPARVIAFTPPGGPREWNLWELERAARDHDSGDLARDEERTYLLMYLRDFAGPDGMLSADFDGLVRDAFGDVLHTVGR